MVVVMCEGCSSYHLYTQIELESWTCLMFQIIQHLLNPLCARYFVEFHPWIPWRLLSGSYSLLCTCEEEWPRHIPRSRRRQPEFIVQICYGVYVCVCVFSFFLSTEISVWSSLSAFVMMSGFVLCLRHRPFASWNQVVPRYFPPVLLLLFFSFNFCISSVSLSGIFQVFPLTRHSVAPYQ